VHPERLVHVLVAARLEVREAHLVEFAVHRPEVGRLHLARSGPPGLDRRLVDRLDAAGADRLELRLVDRLQQRRGLLHELRQPRPAEPKARIHQPLVLAVQRQVPGELVHQHAGDQAHVGTAALDHARGRRRAVQRAGVATLDHRAHVLQHDVRARALRQAMADLVAYDLVVLARLALRLGVRDLDGVHRHLGLVEERRTGRVVGEVAARPAPLVRGNLLRGLGRSHRHLAQHLAQMHLLRVGLADPALALGTEQLALEPLELALQQLDLRGLRAHRLQQLLHGRHLRLGHIALLRVVVRVQGLGHRSSCYAHPDTGATGALRIACTASCR
jgi:hypothetical protein